MPPHPPPPPPPPHFHKLKNSSRRRKHAAAASMGKKGLTSILYKIRDAPRSSWAAASSHYYLCYPPPPSSWPWPSCKHPRTSSFRARHGCADGDAIYTTVNTVFDASSEYFHRRSSLDELDRSCLPAAASPAGEAEAEDELQETVVRGVRSDRLLFDAGATSSAILAERRKPPPAKKKSAVFREGTVVVTMETEDPYGDFRSSMAEVVAAHGLRDWEGLEELLAWYLKLNAKKAHGIIVGAFVDLLVSLAAAAAAASTTTTSSRSPSPSSSSCITLEEHFCVTLQEITEESSA